MKIGDIVYSIPNRRLEVIIYIADKSKSSYYSLTINFKDKSDRRYYSSLKSLLNFTEYIRGKL